MLYNNIYQYEYYTKGDAGYLFRPALIFMNKRTFQGNPQLVGPRIALLRTKRGLSQSELAEMLSECSSRETPYSLQLISAWEQGRRIPTDKMIETLAAFFDVTEEYILGISSSPDSSDASEDNRKNIIRKQDLKKYHGMPVWVAFNNMAHKDQYAILNMDNETLVMMKGYISISHPNVKAIYSSVPDYASITSINGRFPMDMATLLNAKTKMVWVETKSSDPEVQGLYNGWYQKNQLNTMLINSIGLTLPFSGLNISYYAYLNNNEGGKPI